MRATGDTKFTVESVLKLQNEIDGYVTNAMFGVAPKPATKMIL